MDPIDNTNSSVNPVEKTPELQDLDFSLDFEDIEKQASIFVKETKFVPVDESVKLVSVEKNGKIIYEDEGKMQLAESQSELAEIKNEGEYNLPGFFGSFFGTKKSMFEKKDGKFA